MDKSMTLVVIVLAVLALVVLFGRTNFGSSFMSSLGHGMGRNLGRRMGSNMGRRPFDPLAFFCRALLVFCVLYAIIAVLTNN